ncbi:hypothetical protein IGK38_002431 [Enterococcus pernyi]
MLRSIEEFYGTQYRSATIPSYEKSVYETAQQEFSASKYKENLKTEAAVIFKMTMQNLKTQETVYRLEKEAAIGMLALGNQDEQKYNDIIERSNEGILRVQSEITRLEVFQQKDIYDAWNMDKFMESYGRESYAQYKIKLSEARKHRNYQDKERKAEVEFNKIRDNLRKQRKHEVKKVQEGNSLLETLLKDYQSEVKRPTGKRASLIRETAARIEVVLSEQVESYKRLEAFGQISELQKSEQEKDLSTFEETRSKIKALLAQTKELGFNVEVQPGVMDVPGRKDQAKIVDPKPHTQRSEMKIPIHGKTRSNEEGTRHRSSVHIKLMKAKEAEVKSAQSLVEAKLQRIELKLAILISSRQMNELQLLEAQGTNREPILHQEAKRLSKEIKELQKEKVDFTYDLDQLKGQKLEFPVEHLSEQEAENELQQADKNTQANTIETKEVSTENAGLFHENQVSQGLAKQAILVRISKLNDQLTASVADFTYDNEMLGAAKISILAKRAKLITQKIRDIEANDTIPPAEKAGIIKVLRELQNENALEQKAISQENKGKVEWANVLDPKEDEPSEVLIEKAKKLTDQLDNLKKEHQVVKSEIIVQRQEDQDFDQTQGPHFVGTLEFLVQDVQRKERQKEQEKDKNNGKTFENRGIGTDQEGQGKDGRNKGPVPPVPPKPPKEQENKGNDQGQNIGSDQEGQGKDGRNKGPVLPVPPKPPKEQENKGNDQGQNIGGDQEGQGKDGRNKGPVPPVPPKPPKEQENKGNDQGQNIGSDQEGQGKDGRNKGPVPPVPPKPPKEQENKGNDQGQNIGGDQEGQGKDGRNKGPVPPVPPKPPKEQENKGNDQGQNIGGDQEGQGKDGRNKGPVPPVPPKPPKEQENKGNDQGQNIGSDQEGQGKDGRNKGPVPPVPPKPPKEQENKGNDQGQNIGGDQEGQGKDGRNKGPVPPVPPKPPKEQENKGNDQGQNIGGDQEGQGKDGRNKGPVPPVPPKTTRVEGGTQTDFGETNVKKNKNKRKGQKNRQDREHDPVKDSRVERETQTDLEENNKRRNKRPAPPVPQKNRQLEDERPKEKTTKDNGNNPRKGKNRNVGVNTEPAAITQDEENQPNDKKKRRGLGRYFWHKNRNKRASRGIRWLRYLLNLWPIAAWPLCMTWMTVALPFQLIPVVMPAVIATFTAICLSYYLPKIIRFVRKRLLVRRAKKLGLDVRSYIKQKEMERNQYKQNKVRKFFRRNWKTIAIILGVTALLGGIGLFLVPAVLAPILTASTISGLMAMGGVALTGAAISITVQLFEKFGIVRLEKFFDNKYQQQKMNTREESQKTNGNIIYDHRRHDTNLKKAFTELGHMSINLEKAETVKGTKAKLSEITNKGIVKANTQNVKSMDQQKEQKKKEKAGKENKVVGL